MITVTFSASLAGMLPRPEGGVARARSIEVEADNWPDAVADLRERYASLTDHVFNESGGLRPGFLVAVGEEVRSGRDNLTDVAAGDVLYLFTQIAGG